jgi:hypothetical protein
MATYAPNQLHQVPLAKIQPDRTLPGLPSGGKYLM